jgi:hypothetical protein
MGKKQAHLEMIQGVVNRLSSNSFLLKGWCVVLVSALFALAAGNTKPYFVYVAYFPAIAFWVLDGYFVWQEKLFRELYDHVRRMKDEEIDFSMDTSLVRNQVCPWSDVVLSMTLLIFHGTVVIAIVLVTVLIWIIGKGA